MRLSDEKVAELLAKTKLPPGTDKALLAEGVRDAARIFARDSRLNELHNEIGKMYEAADRRGYDEVAAVLEHLSSRTLRVERSVQIFCTTLPCLVRPEVSVTYPAGTPFGPVLLGLPTPEALRDPAQRNGACEAITRLCRSGGRLAEGRRRSGGKRSRPTFRPLLYTPESRTNFPKRDAERDFVMWLSIAWLEATGSKPSRTARHGDASRVLGPFARFAGECLRRCGAGYADPVGIINELNQRRREG
jgi:hypothetical protein